MDHSALGHGGILYRHQLGQWPGRNHKAADMLRQVPWKTHQGLHQRQQPLPQTLLWQQLALLQLLLPRHLRIAAIDSAYQLIQPLLAEPQSLTNIFHGTLETISDHTGGQGCTLTAIFLVDILDHLFAAFMFKIDIDIWRLMALLGNKTLKQHVDLGRIHLGDPEAITDHRVGGRASSLMQYPLPGGKTDQIIDGQEKVFVIELGNQLELAPILSLHFRCYRLAKTPAGALFHLLRQIFTGA